MDFDLDATQRDLQGLAADVLGKEARQDRIEEHERGGGPYAQGMWAAMARAGLLGACLPVEAGGAGLGPVELAVLLRETGARVAPVPALHALTAALAVARYGSRRQREALAPLAAGETVLTVALREPGAALAAAPGTTARPDGGGWLLDGRKTMVSYAAQASRILVPAREGLFLVDGAAVTTRPEHTSTGEPAATVTLEATPAERVGGPEAVAGLRSLALAGIAATVSGVLAGALGLTTEHLRTRRQFGATSCASTSRRA
ncbi:hypothetical protein Misp01_13330 [Microtetraspora sp. NBRC 13810]|uniref:acyl-CoA dehydrogenase family protein n=1 Tax=Microtetraspora sp. NBRC 13810 TaxID=3030990 RepID=UPI0024A2C257|nr:acyl-CoA dehydrogenase family protein [Microtetraspora sp. NBRC 13810]GLW06203.1 hypothetical protein Misp01_13330 [Microtetraspora sp. NBRC 13810]